MDVSEISLFKDVDKESIEAIFHCFKPVMRQFKKGDTITTFLGETAYMNVLVSGRAHLYCVDSEGEYAFLENYTENDIFSEIFTMPNEILGYAVEADSDCEVLFVPLSAIYGRCSKACRHHTVVTQNLFELSAKKSRAMAVRINIISKKTVRRKLMTYFEHLRDLSGSQSFSCTMSLTALAEYLCVDRANMMRELKEMQSDGLIMRKGKQITLLGA